MLHTYVHGWWCVAVQYNDTTLIFNPIIDNYQQTQRLSQHPGAHTIVTVGDWAIVGCYNRWAFSLDVVWWFVRICVAGINILYHQWDIWLPPDAFVSAVDLDLVLIDVSVWYDCAYAIAKKAKAKTVVPLCVTSYDDPIDFCREIMLQGLGVPKYLKNGQYVVHDI